MNFGVMVDVCLGVMSVMILFTLAATAINEMIADNILNMRGKSLHDAIVGLARQHVPNDANRSTKAAEVVKAFYEQPTIQALMETRSWVKWPIASWLSVVKGGYRPPSAIEPVVFGPAFRAALDPSDPAVTAEALQQEFTLVMDRASGWYVRKVKTSLFFIGLFLAIGANVDLLRYAQDLADDASLQHRTDAAVAMITALETNARDASPAIPPAELADVTTAVTGQIKSLNSELQETGIKVGWACVDEPEQGEIEPPAWLATRIEAWASCETHPASPQPSAPHFPWPTASRLACWLIIAFGTTLGAQFWFDLFRTLVNLRTPGKTGGTVEDLAASNAPRGSAGT